MTAIKENKIEKIIDINGLYSRIINNHILDLLKIINSKYPTKFQKNVIKTELDYIMANINLSVSNTVPTPTNKISSSSKPKISKPKLDSAARCQARIWDDIFDRATNKMIIEIDDEFQVSDYNDINIKKFDKKYILGKQCARKKASSANYCLQHTRHRPHGNYLEPPSKELCLHFMIDGGYLQKESNNE
jgi:hypothetical protein